MDGDWVAVSDALGVMLELAPAVSDAVGDGVPVAVCEDDTARQGGGGWGGGAGAERWSAQACEHAGGKTCERADVDRA
jgi:hypothetical protein